MEIKWILDKIWKKRITDHDFLSPIMWAENKKSEADSIHSEFGGMVKIAYKKVNKTEASLIGAPFKAQKAQKFRRYVQGVLSKI